jgi:hypothetical protein
VLFRSAVLALAAGVSLTLWTGCADAPPVETVLPQAVAPIDSQHPDPNAPYVVPAPARNLTPQPAAETAAEAPLCTPDALNVQEIAGNAHGAWHSIKVGFQNRTSADCRMSGYPLVALLNGQGQNLGSIAVERTTAQEVRAELAEGPPASAPKSAPAQSADMASEEVVLVPRAVAAFQVVWSAGANCSSVARLLVTAPGTTHTFSVSQPMSVCTGRIQVTPLGLDQEDD